MTNVIELDGYVNNLKSRQAGTHTVTSFSLAFWNGKKDDKNTYGYIDVDVWDLDHTIKDKDNVKVNGVVKSNSWEKDGKKYSKVFINASSVEMVDRSGSPKQTSSSFDDSDMPF